MIEPNISIGIFAFLHMREKNWKYIYRSKSKIIFIEIEMKTILVLWRREQILKTHKLRKKSSC